MERHKVSLLKCSNYDYDLIKKSILKSFKNLGGIDKYIDKGDKVLLKINLLMKKRPEEATTTHPVFTKALAKVLIDYGAEVIIGDSPGGPFNTSILNGVYRACGIEEISKEVGAELNYNTNSVEMKNEKGLILKNINAIEVLNKVDKVISVSKLKTHGMMMFTGAVKNMFGIVAGLEKAEYHVRMPNIKDFSNALLDICILAKPVLSFMDGIVGMEGNGPSGGDPRQVGAVIASTSPYHLDVVATSLIGINPGKVPTIQRSVERGICEGNFNDIEIIGERIEELKINDFIVPEIRSLDLLDGKLPKFMRTIINELMQPKPVFNKNICVGCEKCFESCPPQVITMINRKPSVKLDECIRCFCCQELCPVNAIDIHRPILMKLLARL
ncbi:DUF362 domain-containing protein [Anaeromonas gelatinilytica]|uniref:DUF362 domain-containing protein n=1 Tax=Anaeromonas gelatinilytica TaxID=2683194 RepID=UPI002078529A|nr:DUF362 domain-containing protein [Anaeromonas gelatinilytica]